MTESTESPVAAPGKTEQPSSLHDQITSLIQRYFAKLEGVEPRNVYDLILEEVDIPVLQAVLKYCRGNQSKAARILGLARGTLRKKLKRYNLL